MESGLQSLSKLFTERLFRIPDYQRGYSWTGRQLKDFWTDLEQLEVDSRHYLGVLTLEAVSPANFEKWKDDLWLISSKNFVPYHIVDGQQRLTTVIILIQCILEKIKVDDKLNYNSKDEISTKYIHANKDAHSGSFLFGYERDNPSYEHLKTKILQRASSKYSTGESTIYTKNLSFAKKFFAEKISNLDNTKLETIYSKVTQHLLFNVFHIEKDVDVHVAFETMNNRGLRLSNLELLKNRLIYLTSRLGESPSNIESVRRTINDSWKAVYYYLGKNQEKSLSDDYFLQIHYLIYFSKTLSESRGQQYENTFLSAGDEAHYKQFLLDEQFTVKRIFKATGSNRMTSTELYQYAMDLKRLVEIYYYVYFPSESDYSADECLWLERLRRLNRACFLHSREAMIACLHLYSTERMPEIRVAFLQALEKYTFLISMLPYKFKKRNNGMKFGAEVLALSCGKNTIKSLHEKLISETRRITEAKDFGMAIVDGLGESGYYGWKELKYFLYEYECSLKAKAKRKSDKIDWETFIGDDYDEDHSSIEHILPQTPVAPYWKEQIAGLSTSQVKKLTNSLGNLLATSQPRNSSLRNAPFPEKKGGSSKKTGYKYGGYSEIEVATNSDWGPSDILSRGLAMLEFLEQRWGTKFGADSDARAKILGIEFLTKPTKNSGSSTPTP